MSGTLAPWYKYKGKAPGSAPVYEPQRAPRERPPAVPDERRRYPTPRDPSPPADPNRRFRPGFDDPRFRPKPVPEVPTERAPRPLRPRTPGIPLGRVVGGLVLVDTIDNWLYMPNPGKPPILPANYQWCNGPGPWQQFMFPNRVFDLKRGPWFRNGGSCTVPPIDSQSNTILMTDRWEGVRLGAPRCYWWWDYSFTNTTGTRGATVGTIERVGAVLSPQPVPYWPVLDYGRIGDPNITRVEPGTSPYANPPRTNLDIGVGTPLPGPEPFGNPELAYSPDYAWQFEVVLDPALQPGSPQPPGQAAPPRLPPVNREPPRRREKQRKVLTRTAKIGIALYKALDAASESAEIVDAVYDALPKDVRKRWEKERFPDARWVVDPQTGKKVRVGVERPGDNFGQYGLDGADWKLQALYHNWHKVDVEQAVKNIIKNELSDRIIGGIQAQLPKNTGAAHSQGERELAKLLDDWFEQEFGL